ncbi:MAG: serine O-acetyltransferase [Christensenellales bacterium]
MKKSKQETVALRDCFRNEIPGNVVKKVLHLLFSPQFSAVFLVRMFLNSKLKIVSIILGRRLAKKYGIFISETTEIGIGLKLPHPTGIVFGRSVVIGKNCTVFQQVTLGSNNVFDEDEQQPSVGNNCVLGAGAKVLGGIVLGNNTTIGANAVVLVSTDDNSTYAGVPAGRIG